MHEQRRLMAARTSASTSTRPRVRRFTRIEYERMVEQGILGPEDHVELIEGEILVMAAKGSRHTTVVQLIAEAAREVFAEGHVVRTQDPIAIDPDSEPEPDVAVVV